MSRLTLAFLGWVVSGSLPALPIHAQSPQPQTQMEVFVSDDTPLPDQAEYPQAIRNIGTALRLTQYLEKDLPGDPEVANSLVQLRLTDAVRAEIESAYGDLVTARFYRLNTLPTVVFDETFVVEGPNSVKEALQIYSQWRQQHGLK